MSIFSHKDDFDEVFRTYYATLVRLSYRVTKRQDVAEDIVQDLFLYLWQKRKVLVIEENFSAYLKKATLSKSLSWFQREKRIDLIHEFDHDLGDESEATSIDNDGRIEALRIAIDNLPNRCRVIFSLNRFEGLTTKEIAKYLDLSPKTVENQLGKALRLLRSKFNS